MSGPPVSLDALAEKIAWRVAEILQDMAAASAEKRVKAEKRLMALPTAHSRLLGMAEAQAIAGGVTLADLRGPSRRRELVEARQAFMLAAHEAGFSLPQIGRAIARDHTTVLHGIRRARERAAQ